MSTGEPGGARTVGLIRAHNPRRKRISGKGQTAPWLVVFTETKTHSPDTGACANNTPQATRPPHRGAC